MSNEKQINRSGWAEDFLSWEKNNPLKEKNNLLWEKMNHRLVSTHKKKKVNMLWAAAALLIITGSFAFWDYQYKKDQETSLIFKKHYYVLPNTTIPKNIETGITIVNQPTKQETIIKKSGNFHVVDQVPLVSSIIQPLVTDSPQIASRAPVIQQKKIRVVHMNEWFSPPPPTFATSGDEQVPYTPSIWPGKHRGLSPPSSNN